MPNTEVKLINAESTWPEAAREDRKLLIKETPTQVCVGVFSCVLWAVSWEPGAWSRELGARALLLRQAQDSY